MRKKWCIEESTCVHVCVCTGSCLLHGFMPVSMSICLRVCLCMPYISIAYYLNNLLRHPLLFSLIIIIRCYVNRMFFYLLYFLYIIFQFYVSTHCHCAYLFV